MTIQKTLATVFSLLVGFHLVLPSYSRAMVFPDLKAQNSQEDKTRNKDTKKKTQTGKKFNNMRALLTAGVLLAAGLAVSALAVLYYRGKRPIYNRHLPQPIRPAHPQNPPSDRKPLETIVSNQLPNTEPDVYPTFNEWDQACSQLKTKNIKTVLTGSLLVKQIETFFQHMNRILKEGYWVGDKPTDAFYDASQDLFQPYVQKVIFPANAHIALHGDFHGDVHSFNNCLKAWAKAGYLDKQDPFKIIDKNFRAIFLGDYVDRGPHGAEVVVALLKFKNKNPYQVFLVRGNHEDKDINDDYGFKEELRQKFAKNKSLHDANILYNTVYRMYNYLPIALYIGTHDGKKNNFVQCCHGGIEENFIPNVFLSDSHDYAFMRVNNLTTSNGFMWSDFTVDPSDNQRKKGRCSGVYSYGKEATEGLLSQWSGAAYELCGILRGHQHSGNPHDEMRRRITNEDKLGHDDDAGLGKLWIHDKPEHKITPGLLNGVKAATFTVAPGAGYGFACGDAYGILKLSKEYKDWRLQMHRLQ